MVRTVSILVIAVAQAASSLTPACFVRCVSAGGHARIEVTGDCHCRNESAHEPSHCCDGSRCSHDVATETSDLVDYRNAIVRSTRDCDCEHSPLMSASSMMSKSRSRTSSEFTMTVALPDWLSTACVVSHDGQQVMSAAPLRPHSDGVALALAVVVLRV